MEDKKFKVESFMKVSELIKFMNAKRLFKNDIVSIIPHDEFFYLIYLTNGRAGEEPTCDD